MFSEGRGECGASLFHHRFIPILQIETIPLSVVSSKLTSHPLSSWIPSACYSLRSSSVRDQEQMGSCARMKVKVKG